MTKRCIIRHLLISCSVALAFVVWPSLSTAATIGVQSNWPGLSVTSAGINLTNTDMVVEGTDADFPETDLYNYVYGLLQTGANDGWFADGSGNPSIYSDSTASNTNPHLYFPSAATDPDQITALGILVNNDGSFGDGPTLATFDGEPVDQNAVLVKYTYIGDTTFDGSVGAGDLLSSVFGFKHHLTQWQFGDFDYNPSGTDSGDLLTADFNFHHPGDGPEGITSSVEVFSSSSDAQFAVVPEPGSAVLCLLGVMGLCAGYAIRRRVRARSCAA
jgi:hypothetical protein